MVYIISLHKVLKGYNFVVDIKLILLYNYYAADEGVLFLSSFDYLVYIILLKSLYIEKAFKKQLNIVLISCPKISYTVTKE